MSEITITTSRIQRLGTAAFGSGLAALGLNCGGQPTRHIAPMSVAPPAVSAPIGPDWLVTGLDLAVSTATMMPPVGAHVFTLTRSELWFDGKVIAHIAADPKSGFAPGEKEGDPRSMFLSSARKLRLNRNAEGKLRVAYAIDRAAPYQAAVELFGSVEATEAVEHYALVQDSNHNPHAIPLFIQPYATQLLVGPPSGDLRLFVVRDGISVKTMGANIAPGCLAVGPGLAVPGGTPKALASCIDRLGGELQSQSLRYFVMSSSSEERAWHEFASIFDALRPSKFTGPVIMSGWR